VLHRRPRPCGRFFVLTGVCGVCGGAQEETARADEKSKRLNKAATTIQRSWRAYYAAKGGAKGGGKKEDKKADKGAKGGKKGKK
jgi:hypothetical protein